MGYPIVLTYDNAPTDNTRFFMETLQQNKWQVRLLGEGEEWEGFVNKIRGYFLALHELPDTQLVLLSDARDVVCLRPSTYFKDGFLSFGGGAVVSMELFGEGNLDEDKVTKHVQCVPLTNYWAHHGVTERPNRKFVNSGLVVGYAKDLKEMYSWILLNGYTSDQLGVCNYMNTFPERVHADIHAELLHTTGFAVNCGTVDSALQGADSPKLSELLGNGAFFLHMPGIQSSIGQRFLYETILAILRNLKGKKLTDAYNYSPLKWREKMLLQ